MKIIVCGLLLMAFTSETNASNRKYLNVWNKTHHEQYLDIRIQLVSHGLLAPSSHNMQPWTIVLDEQNHNAFHLFANTGRMSAEVDPTHRQLMVSQGTFLEYLAIAAEKLGYSTTIELFPEGLPDEMRLTESLKEKPVAKITLQPSEKKNHPFYDFLFKPETNRGAYHEHKLTASEINAFTSMVQETGLNIAFYQTQQDVALIGKIAMEATTIEANQRQVMQETDGIFRINEHQKEKYGYGLSLEGQGYNGMSKQLIQGMLTLFPAMGRGNGSRKSFLTSTNKAVNATPCYIMLTSRHNDRVSQIQSGMLYSRMVLKAHQMGYAVQPLSQAIQEYDEIRALCHKTHQLFGEGGTIQMLVRIGKPLKEAPLSIRQQPEDIIKKQ